MKKIISIVMITALVFACVCGCNAKDIGGMENYKTIIDFYGREVQIPADVKSVICVGVNSLRFTTYLQANDLIVGVEENELKATVAKPFSYIHLSDYEDLPLTGNNGVTYDEEIISAQPDVIVAYLDQDAAQNLQDKTGIPVVCIGHVEGITDDLVYDTINLLGEVYNKQDRAKELTDYLDSIKQDIASRMANIPDTDIPTVYLAGINYKTAHGFEGTEALYGPLTELKAVNIADATGQSTPFDMDIEEVLSQDPDYIFIDLQNLSLINEQYMQNPDYFNSLSAVKNNNVYSQICFRFNATNTEIALSDMYYMGKVLYPEEFEDIDIKDKTNEIINMFLGVEDYYTLLEESGYYFGNVLIGE